MPLKLDLDSGDSVRIGSSTIKLIHKTGRKARLSIDADKALDVELVPASTPFRHGDKRKIR